MKVIKKQYGKNGNEASDTIRNCVKEKNTAEAKHDVTPIFRLPIEESRHRGIPLKLLMVILFENDQPNMTQTGGFRESHVVLIT